MVKKILVRFIYSEKATKFLRNLHLRFDWHYIGQIYGGDFAKFCGLLGICELYLIKWYFKSILVISKDLGFCIDCHDEKDGCVKSGNEVE